MSFALWSRQYLISHRHDENGGRECEGRVLRTCASLAQNDKTYSVNGSFALSPRAVFYIQRHDKNEGGECEGYDMS